MAKNRSHPAAPGATDVDDDIDADDAAKAVDEVEQDLNKATVTIKWRGHQWTIPKRKGRWNIDATREFARGRVMEGLIALIGDEGYVRLKFVAQTGDDFDEFAGHCGKVIAKECMP